MKITACPVCKATGAKLRINSPKLILFHCPCCGVSFVPKQIQSRKQSEDYFDAYSLQTYAAYYKAFRLKIFRENWNIITRFARGGKAIDVGASFGWFLACAPK